MTLPDYPDWTQPVALNEVDVLLFSGHVLPGAGVPPLDMSSLASVSIKVSPPVVGTAAGDRFGLGIDWQLEAAQSVYDTMSVHAPASYGAGVIPGSVLFTPVRGSTLILEIGGDKPVNVGVDVSGTTRVVDQPLLTRPSSNALPALRCLDTGVVPVAAGATSARFYVPPVARRLVVQSSLATPSSVLIQLDAVSQTPGGAPVTEPFATLAANGSQPLRETVDIHQTATELTILNTGLAGQNVRVQVWDVS